MKKYIIYSLIFIISSAYLSALEVPPLEGRVNDQADILTVEEEQNLEQTLKNIETNTSSQFVLLTIISLLDENLEEYSMRVVEEWKLGQKDKDNGVLLLVALNERRIRIEVGYGLEPELPDGRCGTIIRSIITPAFRQGKYFDGINDAFLAMNAYVTGSDNIDQYEEKYASEDDSALGTVVTFIVFFSIALFIMVMFIKGTKSGKKGKSSGFWTSSGSSWSSSSSFSSGGFSGGWWQLWRRRCFRRMVKKHLLHSEIAIIFFG